MTEQHWLDCEFAPNMLKLLRDKASQRKLRLFACESLRCFVETLRRCFPIEALRLPEAEAQWNAPIIATQFADGLVGIAELDSARNAASSNYNTNRWLEYACWVTALRDSWDAADQVNSALNYFLSVDLPPLDKVVNEIAAINALVEDGNNTWQIGMIREVFGNPFRPPTISPTLLSWNDARIPRMAKTIYDERTFDLLPILADALEDAGCTNSTILNHCRQPQPVPHIRGCWVVDLLLGKEDEPRKTLSESDWLTCQFSAEMLNFLRGQTSDRKLRLYASEAVRCFTETAISCYSEEDLDGCFREEDLAIYEERDPIHALVPIASRIADGQAHVAECQAAREEVWNYCGGSFRRHLNFARWVATHPNAWEAAKRVDQALELAVGELPALENALWDADIADAIQQDEGNTWRCGLVRDIFDNPFRSRVIEPSWLTWRDGVIVHIAQEIYEQRNFIELMPELANLLEEAGCSDADILNHCRQSEFFTHVRGCWVLDLLLKKA